MARRTIDRPRGARTMSTLPETDSIPLVDDEPSGRVIFPDRHTDVAGPTLRGHRSTARHDRRGFHVCFMPQDATERVERVECPVLDVSSTGMALVFDHALRVGQTARVIYRTVAYHLVRVTCRVRRCQAQSDGLFHIGLQFTRTLRAEELRPLKHRPGRDLVPGLRARRLNAETRDSIHTA